MDQENLPEEWRFVGDQFADSFNPRRAIVSDQGRAGYLKVLGNAPEDPWVEQWANEQIVSNLAAALGLACVEARAGWVEGDGGAIIVFMEGRKLSDLHLYGYALEPVLDVLANRNDIGAMAALDFWTLNVDRGQANVFITFDEGRPTLRLIDHGHTLLLPRESKGCDSAPEDWLGFVKSGRLETEELSRTLRSGYLNQLATPEELMAAARKVQQLPESAIVEAVKTVDDEFLLCGRETIVTLLRHRQERLIDVLTGDRRPNRGTVTRVAIGYETTDLDRPVAVIVEATDGVFIKTRGEGQFPRRFSTRLADVPEVEPGDPAYFDAVLDSLSTRWLIRHVVDEPTFLVSMLGNENVWEALPRPRVPA